MKLPKTFLSSFVIVAVASMLPMFAAYGQAGDATTGDDAHPTVDSPYLRKKAATPSQQTQAAASLSQKDQKFISSIAAGGVQVVQDAKVAQQQGNDSTKQIASRIVSERGKSNQELLALAKKKGLGLGVDKLKPRNMGKANYDKQYLHTTGNDLQEDVKLLQNAASSSDDKDVKAWAAKTLPMVKGELSAVKSAK